MLKPDSITGALHIIVKWVICQPVSALLLWTSDRNQSDSFYRIDFQSRSSEFACSPPACKHWLITGLGKGNQASAANALWAECPRAKRSHPVRGAVMMGRPCLCAAFAHFIPCGRLPCQTTSTGWNRSAQCEPLVRSHFSDNWRSFWNNYPLKWKSNATPPLFIAFKWQGIEFADTFWFEQNRCEIISKVAPSTQKQ